MNIARTLVLHHAYVGFLGNIRGIVFHAQALAQKTDQRVVMIANDFVHGQRLALRLNAE